MGTRKGTTHHKTDVQGTPDEWVERQMRELRQINREQNRQIDAFGAVVEFLRRNGSVRGEKKG